MTTTTDRAAARLTAILAAGRLSTEFQPVVDLDAGSVFGFEALVRGPAGQLEFPADLFAAARATAQVAELDDACLRSALAAAAAAGITDPTALFVNVDGATLRASGSDLHGGWSTPSAGAPQLVLDISETTLSDDPVTMVAAAERLRNRGFRLSMDNVGAHDLSLALLPLLRPDVIKLDLRLIQRRRQRAVVELMNAINSYAERTGSLVIATGIETEQQLTYARTLGATLGQGWLFGRDDLPAASTSNRGTQVRMPAPVITPPEAGPFECLPAGTKLRRAVKPLLVDISRHLEREAAHLGNTCIVLATFQRSRYFTPAVAARYHDLAEQVGLVVALGESTEQDPLRRQWALTVLSPHFAGAVLARDIGPVGPEDQRLFEFAVTYDRPAVELAARYLMSRVDPHRPGIRTDEAAPTPAFPSDDPGGEPPWRGVRRISRYTDDQRLLTFVGSKDVSAVEPAVPASTGQRSVAEIQSARDLAHLRDLADHDPLTGLLNRRSLQRIWSENINRADRAATGILVLYLDLDGMKQINDRFGHAAGDIVLLATADRLRHRLRVDDRVARVGGDEFVAIVAGIDLTAIADVGRRVATHLQTDLSAPITTKRGTITVTVSIGVSWFPAQGDDLDHLLHLADRRMYEIKRRRTQRRDA